MTILHVLTMVPPQFIFMRSSTETYLSPETPQSQLNQYALMIVATVESLLDTDEQTDAPTYEPSTDLMASKRIPLITRCSSQAKTPWNVSASQQSILTPAGSITEWLIKFDCSNTDLFSSTATDEIRGINFTVSSDANNKDLVKIKVEATDKETIVIDLNDNSNSEKPKQLLKECKDILTPLLVELEMVRHRISVQVALNKSFQKA